MSDDTKPQPEMTQEEVVRARLSITLQWMRETEPMLEAIDPGLVKMFIATKYAGNTRLLRAWEEVLWPLSRFIEAYAHNIEIFAEEMREPPQPEVSALVDSSGAPVSAGASPSLAVDASASAALDSLLLPTSS